MLIALTIPLKEKSGDRALLYRVEHALHPWVAFMILPLFAFANAGVSLAGLELADFAQPLTLGIAAGLYVDAARGHARQVRGHDQGRAAVERERRRQHPSVPDGHEAGRPPRRLLKDQGDRIGSIGRRRPVARGRAGHFGSDGRPGGGRRRVGSRLGCDLVPVLVVFPLASSPHEHARDQQADFEHNYAALKQELMALDLYMQRLVAAHPGKPLFVSHPVYQYFARRYELRLQSVNWEPDVMPDEQEWVQLAYAQETFPALWMLWGDMPDAQIRARLQSLGVAAVVFQPCANRPSQGDFLEVMQRNLDNLKLVFAGS